MKYICAAVVAPQKDGGFEATFPAWPEVSGAGATFGEALKKASDALTDAVSLKLDETRDLPAGDLDIEAPKGAKVAAVCVDAIPASVSLLLTASDASTILGVTRSRISNMLRAGILEEGHRDGRSTVVTLKSVNNRLNNPRKPGRPKKNPDPID